MAVIKNSDIFGDASTLDTKDYVRIIIFSAFEVAALVLFFIFARSIFTACLSVRDSFYFYPTPTVLEAIAAFMEKFNRELFLWGEALRHIELPMIRLIPLVVCIPFSILVLTNARTTKAIHQKRWKYLVDRLMPEQQ
jgi:hypothetical protein